MYGRKALRGCSDRCIDSDSREMPVDSGEVATCQRGLTALSWFDG